MTVSNNGRTQETLNLLNNPTSRQGMSYQQLVNAGLTATEASTAAAGFTGSFGSGQADNWRKSNGFAVGNDGNVFSNTTSVQDQMKNNVNNPTLPANTTLTPTLQTVQGNELMNGGSYGLGATPNVANTPSQASTIQGAAPVTASTVNPNSPTAGVQAQTVDPTFTNAVAPGVAQQGIVDPMATVQGQLASLFADVDSGQVPAWASAAYNKAQNVMAARGMGSSSISAAAITTAYMQSALPIAAQDASTYFQMDMKNLDNRQQTELANLQTRQQNMLTDTSISNAAANFNATSVQQTQQFVASMISQIEGQNADRVNSINTFNTTQANQIAAQNAGLETDVSKFNSQNQIQVSEFNANLDNQRQQFESQMQFAIDQSNVLWQRSVNTANTAAVNAANNTNVQNLYNISQSSLNNLWQQMADNASWAFQASQNQEAMAYNMAMASGNRDFLASQSDSSIGQLLGALGINLLS